MAKTATGRKALKKYPGVYVRDTPRGRAFDIAFKRGKKLIWERVGYESDRFTAELASTIRGNRIQAMRYGEEIPQDREQVPIFGEVADRYLQWAKEHKKSWKDDDARYRMHLKGRLAGKPVDTIQPLDLERVKAELKAEGKAPGTIRQALALFRVIFNKGKAWGDIRAENPMKAVKMPKVDNARERFLSVDELHLLLTTLQKRSVQAYELALLSVNTGARWAEVTGLTWSDVDLNARVVTFRDTKNGRTRRVILNDQAYGLLKAKMEGKGVWKPSEAVFQTGDGRPIRNITTAFQRAADELFNRDLEHDDRRNRVVFHTLRHTAASHMVMAGVPLATVKEILGHSSLAMVDRYSHLAKDHVGEAVGLLGKRIQASQSNTENIAG